MEFDDFDFDDFDFDNDDDDDEIFGEDAPAIMQGFLYGFDEFDVYEDDDLSGDSVASMDQAEAEDREILRGWRDNGAPPGLNVPPEMYEDLD